MKRSNMLTLAALIAIAARPACAQDKSLKIKENLNAMIAQLQNDPDNDALREKIIKLARKTGPSKPEEALTFEGGAEYAVKHAKTPADFNDAADQYKKALLAAPWLANDYYNLGLCQEKGGQLADAIRSLKLYLIAAPSAPDAVQVRKRIGGLQFQLNKEAKRGAESQRKKEEQDSLFQRLQGRWTTSADDPYPNRYDCEISGKEFKCNWIYCGACSPHEKNELYLRGTSEDGKISGSLFYSEATIGQGNLSCFIPGAFYQGTGTLNEDGTKFEFKASIHSINPSCAPIEYGFYIQKQ